MALKKSKEIDNLGITGEYLVAETMNDKRKNKTNIIVLIFRDEEARLAGKSPLERISVPSLDGTYLTGSEVYAGLKKSKLDEEGNELNWFADAEDC